MEPRRFVMASRPGSIARWMPALLLALAGAPAWAVLGGDAAALPAEQTRMQAVRTTASTGSGATVHELRLPDGGAIRQFVNAQGIVYAVAWSTRLKPDFAQLLGRHEADFTAGVAALRRPGLQRSANVDRGDLVVQSAGHPGAFVGKAWLKSQMPANATVDAIR